MGSRVLLIQDYYRGPMALLPQTPSITLQRSISGARSGVIVRAIYIL